MKDPLIRTVGDVAIVFNGNSINAEEKKKKYFGINEGYPFIATKDVYIDGSIDYSNGVRIPFDTDFKVAHPDSVFVCAEGGSAGKKVAYIEQDVCFGNKLFAIQPNKSLLHGRFLYYFVQSDAFKQQFLSQITGIIGGVSAKKFREIELPVPSYNEQKRIVEILDKEFAKINSLKSNAENNLIHSQDLLMASLKKELLPKSGWVIEELKDVVDTGSSISYGIVQPEDDIPGGIPIVRPVDLKGDVLTSVSGFKRTRKEISDSYKRSILRGSEILLCVRGTTGIVSLSSASLKGCNTTRGIVPLCISDDILRRYVFYVFRSEACQKFIAENTNGTTLKQINIADVKRIPIPLAPDTDRLHIVQTLDELSVKCNTLQKNYTKTVTLCEDLKQALLQKTLYGNL